MKKLFTLAAAVLVSFGLMAAETTNVGTYSTQVISSDGLTSTWTFITPSSQVTVPNEETADVDVIYIPSGGSKMKFSSSNAFSWQAESSGYFYVPTGGAGTISMTVKSSSDSRWIQLYVDGTAAADTKRLWSKYAETPSSDGKKGPQSFAFTASDLTTKGGKTYLHFKDNNTEMKIASISITLTSGTYADCNAPDEELSITSDAPDPLYEGRIIHLTLAGGNGGTKTLKLDGEVITDLTWLAVAGEHTFTVSQAKEGDYCAQEAELKLTVLEANPVTAVTVAGETSTYVGEELTYVATAANATDFEWYLDDVKQGSDSAKFIYTAVKGNHTIVCKARNEFNEEDQWIASEPKALVVTRPFGELITFTAETGSSSINKDIVVAVGEHNVVGGTVHQKTDKNGKIGSNGSYISLKLAKGIFLAGDTVRIVSSTSYALLHLFTDAGVTSLVSKETPALEDFVILPADASIIYLYRNETDGSNMNPTVTSIAVSRGKEVKSSTETLTGVTIDGEAISAAAFEGLLEAHNFGTSKEYANAPTVVFTKHVVVTYEDDTTGERDEEITVVAEDKGDYFEAKATIGGIEYSIETDKSTVYTVVFKDGEDELGSENVEVGSHPTAENIELPAKEFQRFAAWQKDGSDIALSDVSAAAGETITLVARYAKVYSQSINIEQIVLDNSTKYDIAAAFIDKGISAVHIDALDTLNDLEKKDNRNYAFLGLKVKNASGAISVLLANNSTIRVKFGNVGANVNVKIGDADPVAKTATDLADPFEYKNESGDDIIVRFLSSSSSTIVYKQIMIDEAIAEVVLPAPSAYAITLEAGEHGTLAANWEGKTDKKVNVPVYANVTLNITPAEGYAIGLVEYEGANVGKIRLYPDEGVYRFTMPEEAVTVSVAFEEAIASVSLDVVFPLVGTEIENKIYGPTDNVAIITVPEGANYELSMYDFWEEGGNVELEGALVENTTYEIRITVEAKAGFAFASNAPILVNGEAAEHIANDAEYDRRDFTVSFQPRAIEEITEVAITIPSFPKLNETVGTNSFEASVPDDAGYTIDNRSFFDEENNYLDHNDYVFTAGTYVVELGIFPKTGFAFPNDGTDCADGTKITMTVNGEDPYGWYGAWAGVPVLFVRAQFTVSDPTGMGNTEVEGKTVKMIENGQVIIIKNGIRYNALGEMIK
ncbi:MAG: hypothetical protein IKX20_02650 [Paludibacteraceae bacterium]|nr:hypothetical protein [Paludibacteraceae bacterium]